MLALLSVMPLSWISNLELCTAWFPNLESVSKFPRPIYCILERMSTLFELTLSLQPIEVAGCEQNCGVGKGFAFGVSYH